MKKGVSPLVAAVLLIAITMTLAAMLSYWASNFVRSRLPEGEPAECGFAYFRMYSCNYDSGVLTAILENVKDMELKNVTAYIIYTNGTIDARPGLANLAGLQIKTYAIGNVSTNYGQLTIKTHCPDVSVTDDCQ